MDLSTLPIHISPFKAQQFPLPGDGKNCQQKQHPIFFIFNMGQEGVDLGRIKDIDVLLFLDLIPVHVISRSFRLFQRIVADILVPDRVVHNLPQSDQDFPQGPNVHPLALPIRDKLFHRGDGDPGDFVIIQVIKMVTEVSPVDLPSRLEDQL